MVWEKSDSCSSIAMLQERFRQLEKVKEMREEKELLKLISSLSSSNNYNHQCNNNNNNNPCYPPLPLTCEPNSNFLYVSEMVFPPLDSQLLSLSLWPTSTTTSQMKKNNNYSDSYWDIKIENTTNNLISKPSWLNDVPLARPSSLIKKIDHETSRRSHVVVGSEVDTTLHL